MAEYIDAEPLKKEIADLKRTIHSGNTDYQTGYMSALSVVEGMIAEQTAVDVEPVRRGHWICIGDIDEYIFECSECHEIYYLNEGTPKEHQYNYCPNCGRKLCKGEENNA